MTIDPHAAGRLIRHAGVREQQQPPGTSAAPQTSSDDGDSTNESPNSEEEESFERPADEGGISDLEGESVDGGEPAGASEECEHDAQPMANSDAADSDPTHGAWLHDQAS